MRRPACELFRRVGLSACAASDDRPKQYAALPAEDDAGDADGEIVSRSFATAEGYALTARTAVEGLLRVARHDVPPGAWTPARAFGAQFIAEFGPEPAAGTTAQP